ncbi:MAG: phytoene/squalene synthase family protein, partial [Proteobacteria bacterium]|nr:phytoene/squalene synthase family protein [Pseudomonadota bacterium]
MTHSQVIDFNVSPNEVIKQGSKSFSLASLFLPKSCREKVLVLYQWCRRCDDAIDDAPDLQSARARLSLMEDRSSVNAALSGPQWLDNWQRSEFIAGMRMDVEGRRYANLQELEQYCFRVAGVVGLMMCPLLGAHPERASAHAVSMGSAMQLTNIARDVQADASIGRIYISKDFLADIDTKVLSSNPELAHLAVSKILNRADELYEHGFEGIYWLPWRVSFAIAIAGKVYQRIGHKLLRAARSNPEAAFRRRTVVSTAGKLVAVAQGILL